MTNKQLLKKYDKITDDICSIGDTGGTHHDTHYYNKQGALEDWCELEDAIREGNTVNGIQVQGITDGSCISIMNRLSSDLHKNPLKFQHVLLVVLIFYRYFPL